MRRSGLAVSLTGAAAGAIVLVLASRSNHIEAPTATATIDALLVWAFVGSGVIAWRTRPDSRFGLLMVLAGLSWALSSLQASNLEVAYTIGALVSVLPLGTVVHVVLAFPTGRLPTRRDRLITAVAYSASLVQVAGVLLYTPQPDQPANLAQVVAGSGVGEDIFTGGNILGALVSVSVIGVLVFRWQTATTPARRAMAPFLWAGAVAAVWAITLFLATALDSDFEVTARLATFASLAVVPLAFLAGLLHSRLARSAVSRLVVELSDSHAPGRVREAIARALGDPSLRLAYWLPESGSWVDPGGRPIDLTQTGDGQIVTLVEREGRRVGALVHDITLADQRELVDGVCAAAGLSLENERLQAELRARLDELEKERDFISTLIDSTSCLVIVLDREGRFVRFNRACELLTGYSFEEVEGRPLWELFIDRSEEVSVRAALERVWGGEYPSENENHWRLRDGSHRLVAWSNTALTGAGGVEYLVSSGLDITDRKRAEEELRASRARILETEDATRRRLERNLHDGAQQRLVALSLALRLAQSKTASDSAEAARILEAASLELSQAIDELRELARGIHPAVLTDRGLPAALEALAGRSPTPVAVDVELGDRLPAQVEAAAYYVVSEALANIAKYAQARSVAVSVARSNGVAVVEVADDGVGGADPGNGSGLRGLSDRVEALNGTLEVASAPGEGTLIRARIPLAE